MTQREQLFNINVHNSQNFFLAPPKRDHDNKNAILNPSRI